MEAKPLMLRKNSKHCYYEINRSLRAVRGIESDVWQRKRRNVYVIGIKRKWAYLRCVYSDVRVCAYILPARSFESRRDYSLSSHGLSGN